MGCSSGFHLGSICSFECESGYVMNGLSRTRCSNSGEWTNPLPECDRVQCPLLHARPHTKMDCSDHRWFGTECVFSCAVGYSLIGERIMRCVEDGRWDAGQPYCRLMTCGQLFPPLNGKIKCSDADNYGSECVYECDNGFDILGSNQATCNAQGRWVGGRPLCRRINCGPMPVPDNARVVCDEGASLALNGYGTSCKIICQPGYRLSGSGEITPEMSRVCQSDGTWSTPEGNLPICEKVTCQELESPDNGRMTCTNAYFFESRCLYSCVSGYELVGARERICMEDGQWTGREASCSIINCPPLRAPVRGNATCTIEGEAFRLSHTLQFSSDTPKKIVKKMTKIAKMFTNLPFGSGCEFSCDEGFQLIGATDAVCRKDRSWSGEIPLCEPISCASLPDVIHGSMECSDGFEHNSVCRFWCKPGHILDGSAARTCSLGRSWTGTPTRCLPVSCGVSEKPRNGRMRCSDEDKYTSVCQFKCRAGYELIGSKERVCQEDGKWSGTRPMCSLIHCGPLITPANGFMRCSDQWNYNSLCRHRCQEGYELVGSEERECQLDRTWTGDEPACRLITCSELAAPSHGKMTCTDGTRYSSTCVFSCDEGYDLSGSLRRQCTETGTWSGATTRCGAASCGTLSAPKHGSIKCSDDDLFGSVCEITCDKGYDLLGASERVCQSNHVWSGATTSCNLVQCDIVIPPRNGNVDCDNGHLYDSECKFTCKVGYNLIGPTTTKCLDKKTWSHAIPTCEVQLCPQLDEPEHATMRCTDNNRFESQCTIFCKLGHEIHSYTEITCGAHGGWTAKTSETSEPYEVRGFPKTACQKISCPKIEAPVNGVMQCTDKNNYDSLCRAQCDPGYDLLGSRARRCQWSGQWAGVPVVCQRITCPTFTLPDTIQITCANSTTDASKTVCRFTPADGYRLVGADKVICLPTGQWSDNFPTTELIECASDVGILHGVADCSKSNKYNSVCNYMCRAGYELKGAKSRTCLASGMWDRLKPVCELATCKALRIPMNGRMYCTNGVAFGSECIFSCELGYQPEDESNTVRTCQEDRTWSGSEVKCKRVECGNIDVPNNGTIVCSAKSEYGSICSYSCDPGFDLRGTQQRVCQADHTWSGVQPTCQVIMCGPLTAPDKGKVQCTNGDVFGSECSFKCKQGYILHGSSSRLCDVIGQWTGSQPVCELVTCPVLSHPPQGRVACTADSDYDSLCKYQCTVGYNLIGAESRKCLQDGSWSGNTPYCEMVKCGHLAKPQNGRIRCSDKNWFNSTCTYECNLGYRIKGEDTRNCLESGYWTGGKEPQCIRKYYGNVVLLNNFLWKNMSSS